MSVKRSARARNPQGQGGRLRADLIAAADRLLGRTGDVEGLSLRAVAREVGIATPSIYLHFPDKAALVRAVLEVRFAELAGAVRAAVISAPNSSEQLRAGCLAYCRFATEHPNAYRVLFGRLPAPASGGGIRTGADAFDLLVQGVSACMRDGVAPDGDAFRVATNVWTALHGLVSLRSATPGFPWPPLERQVDDVLAGLAGLHHNPPAVEG
jgi:AcrR family transcriptional regulator